MKEIKVFLLLVTAILAFACEKGTYELTGVNVNSYVNNDLALDFKINGQNIRTVYINKPYQGRASVNLYQVSNYEIRINDETFFTDTLTDTFEDSLTQVGIYPVTIMATNGVRTFYDTTEIYAIEYAPIWLPGLWGDNTNSARFRIGLDTLFFNVTFCPTRPQPFVVFADSVDKINKTVVFNYQWIEHLNYYNNNWYYLAFNNLKYWLDVNHEQFLFIRYGGNWNDKAGSMADMRDTSYNERFGCYVMSSYFVRRPGG